MYSYIEKKYIPKLHWVKVIRKKPDWSSKQNKIVRDFSLLL